MCWKAAATTSGVPGTRQDCEVRRFRPARELPGRYWFWLLVILIGGLWPIAFFAFGIWIQETMPSCVVSTGGGSSCVIGDMDYAPLLTGLAWTAIILAAPCLLIGAVALLVWAVRLVRYRNAR